MNLVTWPKKSVQRSPGVHKGGTMKTVKSVASDGTEVELVEIDGIQYRKEDAPASKKREAPAAREETAEPLTGPSATSKKRTSPNK
jgi:hypothetical protein